MSEKSGDFFQFDRLQEVAFSALDSVLSIDTKKMFEIKPANQNFNSNETYTHSISFETLFDDEDYVESWGDWMKTNWHISVIVSIAYIILVFTGRKIMENRPKFELRLFLIVWNIFLATFSIAGTIRVWPDFIYTLTKHGAVHSVCNNSYAYGITGFWSLMFVLSKLPELVDTLFIVLRKQELIFLHWYHHATVLIYCWFSYKDFTASGRWFMSMNYLVHSLMYSYYALKAMRVKVPRFISQLITTGQIIQMIAGCYVNYLAYQVKSNSSIKCDMSFENIKLSSLMYLSYFVLFSNFFIKAYLTKKPIKTVVNKQDNNASLVKKLNKNTDENNNVKSKKTN